MQNRSGLLPALILGVLVFGGGVAALSWELEWQHYTSLALGVSAYGTAVTLATAMGSMSAGAIGAAALLHRRPLGDRALLAYGFLEGCIGLCGLLLPKAFVLLERIDSHLCGFSPGLCDWLVVAGNVAVIAPAATCMGASVPIYGLLTKKYGPSLPYLYGANTLGAAVGVLAMGFFCIREFGLHVAGYVMAAINLCVTLGCVLLWRTLPAGAADKRPDPASIPPPGDTAAPLSCASMGGVFLSGFATFVLEVAWFRAGRAAFQSTADVFALLLFTVIIALALGSLFVASRRRAKKFSLGMLLVPGCLITVTTPVLERMDAFRPFPGPYLPRLFKWTTLLLPTIGLPMFFLGLILPAVLAEAKGVRAWSRLYAINAAAAVIGSVLSAWVLLPAVGFNRTAWFAGLLLIGAALWRQPKIRVMKGAALGAACLLLAVMFNSHPGRDRVIGVPGIAYDILAYHEGPDATTSVVRDSQSTQLFIDGFSATGEMPGAEYMEWMGRLPMLLHPAPQTALVICFGTGQTAWGVLDENPKQLDLVDINPAVFKMAHSFKLNHGVLNDPRTRRIVMDGRAWIRRTTTKYDVVTLEPLPPNFAGMNSLYSTDFYNDLASCLNDGAVVAQWLPLHMLTPEDATAIAASFGQVFSEGILWLEPKSKTGILLGRYHRSFGAETGEFWPGLLRPSSRRKLAPAAIRGAVVLSPREFGLYARLGDPVTDDNQLLTYGLGRFNYYSLGNATHLNLELINKIKEIAAAQKSAQAR